MCSESPLCTPNRTTVAEVEAGAENEESDEFVVSYHVSNYLRLAAGFSYVNGFSY